MEKAESGKQHSGSRLWTAPRAIGVVLVIFGLLLWGCGKKGPPKPPEAGLSPPQVSDLSYTLSGDTLILNWTVPTPTEAYKLPAAGFTVKAYRQRPGEPCLNCPPGYEPMGELKVLGNLGNAAGKQRMRFERLLESGYRYTIVVVAVSAEGIAGARSNTVAFDH